MPAGARQKLSHLCLQNEPYDGEDGSDGTMTMGLSIRIPYRFRSKDKAYVLFHNGKAYRLSYLNSCFYLIHLGFFVNFKIHYYNYIL